MIHVKQITTTDKNLQLIQNATGRAVSDIQQLPLIGGNIISTALASASTTAVSHGLGATPTKWAIIDIDANSVVWRASWDANFLNLNCTADCNVKVWVA